MKRVIIVSGLLLLAAAAVPGCGKKDPSEQAAPPVSDNAVPAPVAQKATITRAGRSGGPTGNTAVKSFEAEPGQK